MGPGFREAAVRTSLCVLLVACGLGDDPEDIDTNEPTPVISEQPDNPFEGADTADDPVEGETDAADTDDTDDTPAPPLPTRVIDCDALATSGFAPTVVPNGRAYHGVVFDGLGGLFGNANNLLLRVDSAGAQSVAATGLDTLEQIDILPNGDFVAASRGQAGMVRIAPNGSVSALANVNSVYGVRVGPDGMVYTANERQMHRIDPATGDVEVFLPPAQDFTPKAFDWNIDFTRMYIGTNYTNAKVWVVELDANYDPVSAPTVWVENVGSNWHDGVGVDICGYVYVAEYWSSSLYRVHPVTRQIERLYSNSQYYGHGLTWGSGVGGWNEYSLYMPQPYNGGTVMEFPIDVPYRTYLGPVINRP
jgi:hypothetical protein